MLAGFFSSIVRYAILTVTILAVLSQFGVQTTSLIAVLGAASLAIGLALQGTLSNLAAGVMLLIFRPFKVGEYVEVGGQAGTVNELTLFHTEMSTPDNVHIVMPNGSIWGQPIKNYSYHGTRRVDIVFNISYGDDINLAMKVIQDAIDAEPRCLKEPEPFIGVMGLGDYSVDIVMRAWTVNSDYWPVKFHLTKDIKERFDKSGVTIPFPTRTVLADSAGDANHAVNPKTQTAGGAGAPGDQDSEERSGE